jgi:hypothetical protein
VAAAASRAARRLHTTSAVALSGQRGRNLSVQIGHQLVNGLAGIQPGLHLAAELPGQTPLVGAGALERQLGAQTAQDRRFAVGSRQSRHRRLLPVYEFCRADELRLKRRVEIGFQFGRAYLFDGPPGRGEVPRKHCAISRI